MDKYSLAICICTSGRPVVLDRCLASIAAGSQVPESVIVSDDSSEESGAKVIREVCARYPFVRYQQGPRSGLCSNRNAVIASARTSHVSLLDDDAVVGARFVELATAAITEQPDRIFTGDVVELGIGRCPPTNPSFWGHFGTRLRAGEALRNVHLNCNIFPRRAFGNAAFDERLVYGYEDTDLCDRLVRRGWVIEYRSELVNEHLPPPCAARRWQAERERFAVLFRIRSKSDRLRLRALPWVLLAPVHAMVAYARRGRWSWIPSVPLWTIRGLRLARVGASPSCLDLNNTDLGQQPTLHE